MKADSKNLGPVVESSIFTYREFKGHWGWSSESQGLEKCVVMTRRWTEARGNSNQIYILQRLLWLWVIVEHCDQCGDKVKSRVLWKHMGLPPNLS